jgi:uncharacterized protein (DUF952 family)
VVVATYHLVPREEYERQNQAEDYLPAAFAEDGFIHLTDGADELAAVGNRYYRDDPRSFLALVVDLARVRAPVRYEDPRQIYPHIYGPLNRDAIVAVREVPRAPDGTFLPLADEPSGTV